MNVQLPVCCQIDQVCIFSKPHEEMQHKIDRWVSDALAYLVENYRTEVSDIIASTVAKWDGESTADKLELFSETLESHRRGGAVATAISDAEAELASRPAVPSPSPPFIPAPVPSPSSAGRGAGRPDAADSPAPAHAQAQGGR